ncbi:MAG: hypothetical protein K2K09_05700 [Lachnospiraceae bacterium]|nr:hypothetical protein [Lachnospiraceae bacterium]
MEDKFDDKIKDILDNLDYSEAESLIEDLDVNQPTESMDSEAPKFDYSRIEKMVYEKTGIKKKKYFRFNKYMMAAAAACFVFLVGAITMSVHSFLKNNINVDKSDGTSFAMNEGPQNDSDVVKSEEIIIDEPVYSGSEENPDDTSSNPKEDKDKDQSHKPSSGTNIKTGDNDEIDDFESMPSSDVDKLISDSTSEIDMEGFVVKYSNLEEMIDDSDYIVRGVKSQSILKASEDKNVYSLVAEFKVKSLLVDNIGDDIDKKIRVDEGIRYDAKEEKVLHVGGYKSMTCKKEYILFLKKTSKGNFRIAGLVYGKVPVDEKEDAIDVDEAYTEDKQIVRLVNIVNEARDRFLHYEEESNKNDDKDDDKNNNDNKDNDKNNDKNNNDDNNIGTEPPETDIPSDNQYPDEDYVTDNEF